jgi:hypothetical protein
MWRKMPALAVYGCNKLSGKQINLKHCFRFCVKFLETQDIYYCPILSGFGSSRSTNWMSVGSMFWVHRFVICELPISRETKTDRSWNWVLFTLMLIYALIRLRPNKFTTILISQFSGLISGTQLFLCFVWLTLISQITLRSDCRVPTLLIGLTTRCSNMTKWGRITLNYVHIIFKSYEFESKLV